MQRYCRRHSLLSNVVNSLNHIAMSANAAVSVSVTDTPDVRRGTPDLSAQPLVPRPMAVRAGVAEPVPEPMNELGFRALVRPREIAAS